MNWNCADTDRRLSDYLERLTSPEETTALGAHIEHCADCAALVARVGGAVRLLRAAEPLEVPSYLHGKIIAATSGKQEVVRGWRRWMPAKIAWQPQFAMGAITVAASFLIIFHAATASGASQGFATLNPVNLVRAADRQIHLTYAHTAKFVSDMRLVYEIESRLQPDEDQSASPTEPPAQSPNSQPQPRSQTRLPRSTSWRVRLHGQYATLDRDAGQDFSLSIESDFAAKDFVSENSLSPETLNELHFAASRSRS